MNDDLNETEMRTLLAAVAMHALIGHPAGMSIGPVELAAFSVARADCLLAELKKPK